MKGHYILKLNNKCNMNCSFCADSHKEKSKEDPDPKKILSGLRENRLKFDSLIITGGEPTICKNLITIIKYAKQICKYNRICLVSNGLLLSYQKFLDNVISAGVDSFQISYFALNDEKHSQLSRTPNSFKYLNKCIKNIVDKKIEIRINLVINKLNYKDLPKIVNDLIKKGVHSITLAQMNPIGKEIGKKKPLMSMSYEEIIPSVKKAIEENKDYQNLKIENFPICLIENFEDYLTDIEKPIENEEYYNSDKIKPEKCLNCNEHSKCQGIWKSYYKLHGDTELNPLKNDSDNLLKKYLFEIAGLELGIKKASILYLKKEAIPSCAKELKKEGYFYEMSKFSYTHDDERTKKARMPSEHSEYSLYISKDKNICKRLKYLDYYHQLKLKEPTGITTKEIFFEIREILGYPKCCSKFLMDCHRNNSYKNLFEKSGREYEDETIYKLLALSNSKKTNWKLNNFSLSYPSFFNFFICNYNCQNALKITEKLLAHIKEKYPDYHKKLINDLKRPILLFSAYRIISFSSTREKNGKIYYENPSYDNKVLRKLHKDKIKKFKEIFNKFLDGDSLTVDDNICIYKNNKLIHKIKKEHKNHGVFIEFK